MRDDFTTKERTGAGTGEVLARLGYALVGALVAVLVSAMMSLVPWPADDTLFPVYVNASVMGATLMLWASFKPSRGSAGAVAAEALTVFVTVLVVQMVGSCLQSPSLFGLYSNPLSWVWDHAIFMLYSGLALVLPISWALGSDERWARRSFKRVLGELAFVLAAWALAASGVLDSAHSLIGFMVQGLVFVASALATAAVFQRLACALVGRYRAVEEQSAPRPRHAPPVSEPRRPVPRANPRAACIAVLVGSVGVSVCALAFFFVCQKQAAAQGLELRNIVYDIPTACVLVTCFVAIPFVLVGTLRGSGKDYRLAGYAALCAIALLPTMLSSTFRLEPPEETYLGGGAIEVVTPEWFDTPRVEYATSEGPLFMRMLSNARLSSTSDEGQPLPPVRSGYSYHNTGNIVSIDHEALVLVLAITQSTEDIATGTQVSVDCASTEHFDVPFDELAVGDSVQIRSTEAHTDGAIVAQKVFGPARDLVPEQQGRVEEETLDDILASYDCGYTVSGTVTSAVEENGFSFRVDDGGGFIENGTELRVSTAFVERRLYGMKGLQWWMDGVIVGFSDLPAEGVLRAKVIVGNDDTSSDYWENMPAS